MLQQVLPSDEIFHMSCSSNESVWASLFTLYWLRVNLDHLGKTGESYDKTESKVRKATTANRVVWRNNHDSPSLVYGRGLGPPREKKWGGSFFLFFFSSCTSIKMLRKKVKIYMAKLYFGLSFNVCVWAKRESISLFLKQSSKYSFTTSSNCLHGVL